MRTREILLFTVLLLIIAASCSNDETTPVESPVVPELSINNQTVAEGNTAIFRIVLDQAAERRVVFSYFTSDVSALTNVDYVGVSGVDTIPVNSSSVTILVTTIDDGDDEPDEVFSFTVTSVSNAEIADSVGIGTIIDNDIPGVSFVNDVRPILLGSCALVGCHGGGSASSGLSLGDASWDSVIVAVGVNTGLLVADSLVVQPGNSATSTLYTKVTASPPFPGQMPSGFPALTSEQQGRIRDWIDEGAQDN